MFALSRRAGLWVCDASASYWNASISSGLRSKQASECLTLVAK
jgi:hypothetical protein